MVSYSINIPKIYIHMLKLDEIQDESNGIYKDCGIDWFLLTVIEMQKKENNSIRSAIHQLRIQCASQKSSMPF